MWRAHSLLTSCPTLSAEDEEDVVEEEEEEARCSGLCRWAMWSRPGCEDEVDEDDNEDDEDEEEAGPFAPCWARGHKKKKKFRFTVSSSGVMTM